jgi:hypothetical protein
MSRRFVVILVLVAAFFISVRPASAQQGVTELGFDMAIAYETESEIFSVSLPLGGSLAALFGPQGGFRAGFFLGDLVSLEPSLNFQLLSGNDETEIAVGSSLRILYHFSADATRSRFFLAAGPTFTLVDFGSDSSTQFGLNGELGVKLPIADRVGTRLGVGYTRGFETDDFGTRNIIYATAGLSMFLGGT